MLEKTSISGAKNRTGDATETRRALAPAYSSNSHTELSHQRHRRFRAFYDTLPPHPWFILTFTQQLRNPSPERGLPVLRLVFVVIVTLNKRRTSGHRLRLYNPLRSFDCQSEESMLLTTVYAAASSESRRRPGARAPPRARAGSRRRAMVARRGGL